MEDNGSKVGGEWTFLVNTLFYGNSSPVAVSILSRKDHCHCIA